MHFDIIIGFVRPWDKAFLYLLFIIFVYIVSRGVGGVRPCSFRRGRDRPRRMASPRRSGGMSQWPDTMNNGYRTCKPCERKDLPQGAQRLWRLVSHPSYRAWIPMCAGMTGTEAVVRFFRFVRIVRP